METQTPPIVDFAGIKVDENAVASDIALVDSWELITVWDTNSPARASTPDQANNSILVPSTGVYEVGFNIDAASAAAAKVYEFNAYEIAAATIALTGTTKADPVVATAAAAHGLSNGNEVLISGVTTMTEINDRIFKAADKAATTFELTDDGGASPGNDIDGSGFTGAGTGGTAQLLTKLANHAHREFAAGGDIGSTGDSFFCNLTAGNRVALFVKNVTDANNLTLEHASLRVRRIA